MFVDLDQNGADEAQERVFAGKDPDLGGAPFEFLLDGALIVPGVEEEILDLAERTVAPSRQILIEQLGGTTDLRG